MIVSKVRTDPNLNLPTYLQSTIWNAADSLFSVPIDLFLDVLQEQFD
jgi:hypothetical protein